MKSNNTCRMRRIGGKRGEGEVRGGERRKERGERMGKEEKGGGGREKKK